MPAHEPVGVVAVSSSIRVHVTALAGSALTFFDTNTRPREVADHEVDVSAFVRSTDETSPPARSPQAASVSRVGPSSAQSPQGPA